jgi:polysaccharide biosynthesis protein VpsQ
MKWVSGLFALFIILIIVMADAGVLAQHLGFLYAYPYGDKAGHFVLYGILALLINLTLFRSRPDQRPRLLAVKCGLILALLIGLEEFSQQWFANRTFDLIDLTFSYLGLTSFSILAVIIKK